MEKPRVVRVKDLVLEERAPPSQEEFEFVEVWEPEESGPEKSSEKATPVSLPPSPSFFSRLKSMLGLR